MILYHYEAFLASKEREEKIMNNIQIFNSPEFGEIRTVVIDGEPWFVARDISEKLGYVKTFNMTKLIDDEDRKNISSSILEDEGYKQNYTIGVINESGLYAAIIGSKLENAKKFKRWVTSEVLPSIRKTGTYGQPQIPQTTGEKIALLAQGHVELKAEIDSVKEDLEQFKMDMPILGVEIDKITAAVHKRGVNALGGKESNAYNDRSLRGKVYSDIHRELKRQFGVTTYKAIKRSQCELAITIIDEYELPHVLSEEIENCNAQIKMEVA